MQWTVETLNEAVDEELAALPVDMRAHFVRIAQLIEDMGLERLGQPHVRHLQGPVWEMRMTGKAGISRALYITARAKRVIILRVFVKKSQKTPNREIKLALQRAKELGK